jgi:isopentenyl phosphate kinase
MSKEKIDIIKLGGSVITDKTSYRKSKKNVIQDLAKIISKWDRKCIVVHGAGSFGHILAEKYSIVSGYKKEEQLEGLTKIRYDMNELKQSILEIFGEEGIRTIDFQTSALVYRKKNTKEETIFLNPIKKTLELGLLPLLAGDILFTDNESFTIYSGDSLIDNLCKNFDVGRVVFITDVDGLMISDSDTGSIRLLENTSYEEFKKINLANFSSGEKTDVTGSMVGKLSTIKSILDKVDEIIIVNGNNPERIQKLLENSSTICTSIIGEKSTKR